MYYPIKVKEFTTKSLNNIDIDEDLLEELLLKNIIECPYSTFPYMTGKNSHDPNSYMVVEIASQCLLIYKKC